MELDDPNLIQIDVLGRVRIDWMPLANAIGAAAELIPCDQHRALYQVLRDIADQLQRNQKLGEQDE